MNKFSRDTFKYFDSAARNKNNLLWFEKNKTQYLEKVRAPFSELVETIGAEFQSQLPRIEITSRSITRPVRPKNRADEDGGLIKNFAHITLWEKKTSLFEWNPGIHFQVGTKKDDNFLGLGLYMVSSRQLSLLRNALVEDFEEIDALLSDRKLKKAWGGVKGDRYVRFPKGFNSEDPNTKYLWHKQFYLGQNFSRAEVIGKGFTKKVLQDLKIALPFFKWVRSVVGVYGKR